MIVLFLALVIILAFVGLIVGWTVGATFFRGPDGESYRVVSAFIGGAIGVYTACRGAGK